MGLVTQRGGHGERTNCLAHTDVDDALCHECIIHGDDVYLVDALRLELIVLLDVSWHLQAARGREGPRHADLCLYVFVRMFFSGGSPSVRIQPNLHFKEKMARKKEGKERCADGDDG